MKQVQKSALINDILHDDVWWCNIKWFLSCSKNYISYFMQPNSWHKYSTFICPFESGKCGKEEKKCKNLNIYLESEKTFLDKIKSITPFGVKVNTIDTNLKPNNMGATMNI